MVKITIWMANVRKLVLLLAAAALAIGLVVWSNSSAGEEGGSAPQVEKSAANSCGFERAMCCQWLRFQIVLLCTVARCNCQWLCYFEYNMSMIAPSRG